MTIELKIWRDGNLNGFLIYCAILKINSCLDQRIYLPCNEIEMEYIGGRKTLIEIDYLITNLTDVKFTLLHLKDELVKEYFDLENMFKLRLKYFDEPIQLI